MRIVCNAGTIVVTHMGTLKGYGEVWYHPDVIANMLSLSNVQVKSRGTYDSETGNRFFVHRPDGTQRVFEPTRSALYASGIEESKDAVERVTTLSENVKSFSRREVKRAEAAYSLMAIIGRPSETQM